jgi:hypothetical protein
MSLLAGLLPVPAWSQKTGKAIDTPSTANKIPVESTPRVSYRYGPNMRFGITASQTPRSGAKQLTYSDDGTTNMGVIRLDGRTDELGGPAGRWQGAPARRLPARKFMTQATWLYGPLRVTQVLDIVPNPQPVQLASGKQVRRLDRCLVLYVIQNADRRSHKMGLRLEIDTLIGTNDGVPFTVPGLTGLVDTQHDIPDADQVPEFIQALERPDLKNPGTIAQMSLKVGQGVEPPSRLSLTHWTAGFRGWDVPLKDMARDSAVILYWAEKDLPAGQKRIVGFAYGLGSIATKEGKLGLTLSGRFEKSGEFTAVATVTSPIKGMTVKLLLPPALERTKGKEEQTLADAAGSAIVTWRVRARDAGQFKVEVQTSNGWNANQTVTISEAPLLLNPLLVDPKKK